MIVGVRADGTKELVAIEDGYRESTQSWADVSVAGPMQPRIRHYELVDWAGAIGSTVVGFVLGGLILLAMVVRERQRRRADPTLAENPPPVSVRVDRERSRRHGWWAAAATVAFALALTPAAGDRHPARFFFGLLLAEGVLFAVYAFFCRYNRDLPDLPADEFRAMSIGQRYATIHSYGAGRIAGSIEMAARLVLALAVPGLLISLLVR